MLRSKEQRINELNKRMERFVGDEIGYYWEPFFTDKTYPILEVFGKVDPNEIDPRRALEVYEGELLDTFDELKIDDYEAELNLEWYDEEKLIYRIYIVCDFNFLTVKQLSDLMNDLKLFGVPYNRLNDL